MKIKIIENNEIRDLTPIEKVVLRTALKNMKVQSTMAMEIAKQLYETISLNKLF